MYDLPEVRAATDAWWSGLARYLRSAGIAHVPDRLQREPAPAWSDPELLLGQACGYPLTHALAGRVRLVCTPCYAAPGCDGPLYSSVLVVREACGAASLAELRGTVCAINARDSHSGCNVLRAMLAPMARDRAFFARVIETGSHEASLDAVATGEADLCAVDAVLHALLQRHAPDRIAGTRVLGFSPAAPGLPYIAARTLDAATIERMRSAIAAACADPSLAAVRAELLLDAVEFLPLDAYAPIARMACEASEVGYAELH